jgi:hypothetical protein
MSAVCPDGHASATADYCDQCGRPIGGAPGQQTEILPVVEEADTSQAALLAPCPSCGMQRSGDDRYCETCGYDFSSPQPRGTAWEAIVEADRVQFDRSNSEGFVFPTNPVSRHFRLAEDEYRIGRSRDRSEEASSQIMVDDPCVSREHAVLVREDDGSYAVRDLGSTNGTFLNDDPTELSTTDAVVLSDGDTIRIGAWTAIAIRARDATQKS